MKYLVLIISLLVTGRLQAQMRITFEDTTFGFRIDAPTDWTYGKFKEYGNLPFLARKPVLENGEKFHENYNVNIFKQPGLTLTSAFKKLIHYNSQSDDYELLTYGERRINQLPFYWALSSHTNNLNHEKVINYTFITYKNDFNYIITFIINPDKLEAYKPFYDEIADSFIILK